MNKKFIVAALISCFAPLSSHATGFYMGLDAGMGFPSKTLKLTTQEVKTDGSQTITKENIQMKSTTPFIIGANMGYGFANSLRAETSFQYIMSTKLQENNSNNADTKRSAFVAMTSLYYDFKNLSNSITPFVGIGIGYGKVQIKDPSNAPLNVKNDGLAYGGSIGLSYAVNNRVSLDLKYSYTRLPALQKKFENKYNPPKYIPPHGDIKSENIKYSSPNQLYAITAGVKLTF